MRLLLALLIAVALGWTIFQRASLVPAEVPAPLPSFATELTPPPVASASPRAESAAIPRRVAAPSRVGERIRAAMPRVEELRKDVQQDPHRSPPSLAKFARELDGFVEEARRDVARARELMPELAACAGGRSPEAAATVSIRVHCLREMRRVAEAHRGVFEATLRETESAMDPAARRVLRMLGP